MDRGAAGEEQPLRGRAALLAAVKLDGLVDLNVEPRHDLAGDFSNGGGLGILRFFVGAPEADGAFFELDGFGVGKTGFCLMGEILGDGIGPDVDAAA